MLARIKGKLWLARGWARHEVRNLCRRPRKGPKIFCIGFNKTGTTSLGMALAILGYDHCSYNPKVERYYLKGRLDKVLEYTSRYESFDDSPWLKEGLIPVLDKNFPGSKYIYLERDELSWKGSYTRFTKLIFGASSDADIGWNEYCQHREFVLNYFRERSPAEFLVLDVRDPVGFRKLANFLGKAAPQDAFPHVNRSGPGGDVLAMT